MKKVLTILVTMMLACSVIFANGAKEEATINSDQIELTFWSHTEPIWNDSYKAIATDYMAENPNVKINLQFFPYVDFESKIQTSLISKNGGADIYEMWGGWGQDFSSNDALAALPDSMATEIMANDYPATYGSLVYGGKLYGMPLEFNSETGLFINLNLFHKAGFTESDYPTTWNELISLGQKGTVMKDGQYKIEGFDFLNGDAPMFILLSMILSNGGTYINADGTVDFTNDVAKASFEKLAYMATDAHICNLLGATGGDALLDYENLFIGNTMMCPRGAWVIPIGTETYGLEYDKDFTYISLPWTGPDKRVVAESGWALSVDAQSKHKQAAFDFIKYFYRDDILLKHDIKSGLLPPSKAVGQSAEYKKAVPEVTKLVASLVNSEYIGYFNTDIVKNAVIDVLVDYVSGEFSNVDEALQSLTDRINVTIK